MKEKPKYWLAFNRCSTHGFEMISIDDDNGGLRVFGGKCCGSWKTAKRWPIDLRAANECAESFYKIAKELSGGDLARIWAPDALNAGKADLEEKLSASEKRVKELEAALTKINALRNDIVGRQAIGFSRHVYPLVEILNEAGFPGMSYEDARAALEAPHEP